MQHVQQMEQKDAEMSALRSQAEDAARQHHVQLTRSQMEVSNYSLSVFTTRLAHCGL